MQETINRGPYDSDFWQTATWERVKLIKLPGAHTVKLTQNFKKTTKNHI